MFHWKYNLDDIDVSEEIIVDTLPVKKSSESKDEILGLLQDFKMCKRVYQTFTEFKCVFLISNYNNKIFSRI